MKPFKILGSILGLVAPRVVDAVVPGGGLLLETLARSVTGEKDMPVDELESMVVNDPELLAQVRTAAMEKEVSLEQEATKQLEAQVANMGQVNETMRAELEKGDKFQKYWRPLNGYLLGITLFINYGVLPVANGFLQIFSEPLKGPLGQLTMRQIQPASIPEMVFMFWAGVVGVAVHSRGQEKLAKLGKNSPSLLQTIVAGFKK